MSTGCIIGLVVGVVGLAGLVIIAILASLAIPTFQKIQAKAHSVMSKVDIKQLELAFESYQTEYNKLPELGKSDERQVVESKGDVLNIIMAKDAIRNPRGIEFFDPPTKTSNRKGGIISDSDGNPELQDPFGNLYHLHFDWNADGMIPDPEHPGSDIPAKVIIYSAGPDLDYSTWKDNVTSWKP